MRVEVTRNGTPSVGVEGVQGDPASGRVGKFTGGKEGRELRKFGKETVHFTVNTKGLGGREEEYVSIIRWANRERRRAVSTFWKLPFVFNRFYEGFQVFKGFHGLFFKKGRGYPGAKVPEDLWGCDRENIFTGEPWDGVGAKGREPVFRVKIIIEKALLCGKKNRSFLIKFTSLVGEVLGDRETFIFSGKREGGGTAWRLGRPTYKVGREGVVLRLDHQGLFRVNVPLTHRGRSEVVAARGSKQCPPSGIRRVHSGSGVGRWVGEVDNVHMRSMKREGVQGKAENNTRVTRQRAVPFEMFCIHLPCVTRRELGAGGEVEEVGGRAISETHDKGEKAPIAEVSDLVSDLPTVVIKC